MAVDITISPAGPLYNHNKESDTAPTVLIDELDISIAEDDSHALEHTEGHEHTQGHEHSSRNPAEWLGASALIVGMGNLLWMMSTHAF